MITVQPASFVARSYAMRRLVARLDAWPEAGHRVALFGGEVATGRNRVAARLHHRWHRDAKLVTVDCRLGEDHVRKYFADPAPIRAKRPGTLVFDGVDALDMRESRYLWKLKHNFGVGEVDGWTLVCIAEDAFEWKSLPLRQLPPSESVRVPALRQRRLDMPRLVHELVDDVGFALDHPGASVASDALDALSSYEWPGNITELQATLEHALVAVGDRPRVELRDLPAEIRGPALAHGATGIASLAEVERQHILETLRALGGNRGETAAALGIHVNTLCNKLAKYGVGRRRRRRPKQDVPASDRGRA